MFNLESNIDDLSKKLGSFSGELNESLESFLVEYMEDFKVRLVRERMSGRPGVKRGSGDLQRSLEISVSGTAQKGFLVRLSSDLPYAGPNDDGATIRAAGKLLTIPLPGVTGSIRDYDGFFFESKKGNLLFAQKVGKNGLRPLFVLKDKIVIPARIKSDEFFEKDERNRNKELVKAVDNALDKVFS